MKGEHLLAAGSVILLLCAAASADVFNMPPGLTSLEMVTVGNPGNAADTRYVTPGYGAVAYEHRIGKYEVTAGQYTTFLNAVAKTDTYGLYNTYMDAVLGLYGCNIIRSGSPGSYTYSVDPNWANRPVNYVSWGDSARFVNWLTNGQPTTSQAGAHWVSKQARNLGGVRRKPTRRTLAGRTVEER